MPHKGQFTQSACVLLNAPISIEAVARMLAERFEVLKTGAGVGKGWLGGGNYVLLNMRVEVNGKVVVDVVDAPWPDGMGDPKKEPELFGAWATGFFGPGVY